MSCAVLHAHSQFLQPMQTVVSTSTPILPGDRMFFGPALATEVDNPVNPAPIATVFFRKSRRFSFAIDDAFVWHTDEPLESTEYL